jgi:adenylate cyclase
MSETVSPSASDGASGAHRRKLTAILFVDVVSYTRLMREDESATYDALKRLRGAIDPIIVSHAGRIVSTAGDGVLADFGSVVDALSCALRMQQAAYDLNSALPADRHLQLRIGVNLGDVIVAEDNDLYGDGVNIASRLQALAAPGGICLSGTAYEQVKTKLDLNYRFLGAQRVKNIAEPVRVYSVGVSPRTTPMRLFARWRGLIAVASAGVAIAAGLIVVVVERAPQSSMEREATAAPVANLATPARLAERIPIAVLPFKNMSPDAGQDFFSDGITEDIINALGRFSNFLVSAKSASFQFKGRTVSPEEAGRTLDVRYIVEGSVRRAGDRLRITVELVEATSGVHLWSDIYNAELKDVFTIQDQITERIVGLTAVTLTRVERDRVLRKPTTNLGAYEYVLRGRAELTSPTRAANDEARAQFQRAVDLDPNYAGAYVALGWTHYEAAVSGWTEFPNDDVNRAESLAQKALALDPTTTRAFQLLGNIDVFRRDYDRALAEIDRALALNPSEAESFRVRGYILLWSGKPAEAVPWLEGTLRFDSVNSRAGMNLAVARYLLGQYEAAIAAGDRVTRLDTGRIIQLMIHPVLAASYARLGNQPEVARARAIVERLAPFFDPERYAAQFGTQEAREDMLAGLRAAGFR